MTNCFIAEYNASVNIFATYSNTFQENKIKCCYPEKTEITITYKFTVIRR